MGIADTDRTLPSNRLIFEIRRDPALYSRFPEDLEQLMNDYGLADEEKAAWRAEDLAKLAALGVHPYMIPQVSRLFHGAAYNHNKSEAALTYAKHMVPDSQS